MTMNRYLCQQSDNGGLSRLADRVRWDNGCLRLLRKESTEWDVETKEVDKLAVAYFPELKGVVFGCARE
jgi:hypothetical protein